MTTILEHDQYLAERTGCYEYREIRYAPSTGIYRPRNPFLRRL